MEKDMFDLIGLGNALVDIEVILTEEEFIELGVVKNSMTLVSDKKRKEVLSRLESHQKKFSSGGSVGNTLYALSKKGHRIGMVGFVGDDLYGEKYQEDLEKAEVKFLGRVLAGRETGTSLILITPDGNRTMLTTLGCASDLNLNDLEKLSDDKLLRNFLVESYLLFGEENIAKITNAIDDLNHKKIPVLLSDSDAFCVEQEPDVYNELFKKVDVFFTNVEQARAMHRLDRDDSVVAKTMIDSFHNKSPRPKMIVVTAGEQGAYIAGGDKLEYIPIVPTKVVDTNGAGDAFSAGVIDGYLRKKSLLEMGQEGAKMASRVVSRYGARW